MAVEPSDWLWSEQPIQVSNRLQVYIQRAAPRAEWRYYIYIDLCQFSRISMDVILGNISSAYITTIPAVLFASTNI